MIRILLVLLAVALALPEVASAAGRSRSGHHHSHHHTVFVGSAFYFGPPMWYAYHYAPYYYGPYYEATTTPPSLYIEKFDGTPDMNSGEIYCPSAGQFYPDVQDCANGWQRIIRAEAQGG